MIKYITLTLLFIAQFSFGQNKSIPKIIDQIEIQEDTLLAVYNWVTDNIKYDVRKLKKLENGANFYKEGNYKSVEEYLDYLLKTVIQKKKGVCDDYTLLFDALVSELGYESFIVRGITKRDDGEINKNIGHSWNAVKVDGEWKLYDPTWGAGYINDKDKYVKKYNAKWYNRTPEKMRETHLPFDPIWQLSDSPIYFEEFKNASQAAPRDTYDYNLLITQYLQKGEKEQVADELSRIESNASNIKAIENRANYLKGQVTNLTVPSIIEQCNASASLFGDYFKYGRNKQFGDKKWNMEYSESVLIQIQDDMTQAKASLEEVNSKDQKNKRSLKKLISMTKKLIRETDKELKFLRSKM